MVMTRGSKQKGSHVTRGRNDSPSSYSSTTRKRKNTTTFAELDKNLSTIKRRRNIAKSKAKVGAKTNQH